MVATTNDERNTEMATQAIVDAVKAHALAHYEDDGWDIMVETMTDDEIAAMLGDVRTAGAAITKAARELQPLADYRADIRAEIF